MDNIYNNITYTIYKKSWKNNVFNKIIFKQYDNRVLVNQVVWFNSSDWQLKFVQPMTEKKAKLFLNQNRQDDQAQK